MNELNHPILMMKELLDDHTYPTVTQFIGGHHHPVLRSSKQNVSLEGLALDLSSWLPAIINFLPYSTVAPPFFLFSYQIKKLFPRRWTMWSSSTPEKFWRITRRLRSPECLLLIFLVDLLQCMLWCSLPLPERKWIRLFLFLFSSFKDRFILLANIFQKTYWNC